MADALVHAGTDYHFGLGNGLNRVIFQQSRGSNNYYYCFYVDDSDDLILEYSTNGTAWSNTVQTVYTGTVGHFDVKIYDSGSDTKFFVVLFDTAAADLTYIRGSLSDSGTTPSWDSAQDIDSAITVEMVASHCCAIARTDNGRLVVVFTEDIKITGKTYRYTKIIGSDGDGASPTWSGEETVNDPTGSTNNDDKDAVYMTMESFSSSYPNRIGFALRQPSSTSTTFYDLYGYSYDWAGASMSQNNTNIIAVNAVQYDYISLIINDSDYAHVIYHMSTSSGLTSEKTTSAGNCGPWASAINIIFSIDACTLALDRTNDELYAFYHLSAETTTYHYKVSDVDTISWGSEQDITSTDTATHLSCWNSDVEDYLHLAYVDDDGDIYYDSLQVVTPELTDGPNERLINRLINGLINDRIN